MLKHAAPALVSVVACSVSYSGKTRQWTVQGDPDLSRQIAEAALVAILSAGANRDNPTDLDLAFRDRAALYALGAAVANAAIPADGSERMLILAQRGSGDCPEIPAQTARSQTTPSDCRDIEAYRATCETERMVVTASGVTPTLDGEVASSVVEVTVDGAGGEFLCAARYHTTAQPYGDRMPPPEDGVLARLDYLHDSGAIAEEGYLEKLARLLAAGVISTEAYEARTRTQPQGEGDEVTEEHSEREAQ